MHYSNWCIPVTSLIAFVFSILLTVGIKCGLDENISNLICQVLLSYVAATIFYWASVILKKNDRRKKQKWLIYDVLNKIRYKWQDSGIGHDSFFGEDDVQDILNFTKDMEEQILQIVSLNLEWKDEELKHFYEINDYCHIIEENIDYVNDEKRRNIVVEALWKLEYQIQMLTTNISKDITK